MWAVGFPLGRKQARLWSLWPQPGRPLPASPGGGAGGTSHLPLPAQGEGAHAHQPLPSSGRPRAQRSPPLPSHAGSHRPGDKRKQRPQLPSWTWDLGAEASGARTTPRVGTGGAQPCPGPTRKVSSAPWRDVTGRGVASPPQLRGGRHTAAPHAHTWTCTHTHTRLPYAKPHSSSSPPASWAWSHSRERLHGRPPRGPSLKAGSGRRG